MKQSAIKEFINGGIKIDKNFRSLIKENGKNFYYYLTMISLDKDPDPLILSPLHHYYYDLSEIKNVKTIIQIKELNKISDLNKFLNNIVKVISPDTNFVGCFKDDKIYGTNILRSTKFTDWLFGNFESKPNHYMSRQKVMNILTKYEFNIMDITEFDNMTYFYAKK